jgi:branched-chain amino acid transport system permease protein
MAGWAHNRFGLPVGLSLLAGIGGATIAGFLVERMAIRPVRCAQSSVQIIVTVGISLILKSIAALAWGTEPFHLPPITPGGIQLFGVFVEYQNLWMLVAATICLAAMAIFFRFTRTGRAMRACSENPEAARLCGISPNLMSSLAFGLSAVLDGVGGVLLTPLLSMSFDRGTLLGLKGFSAAILGGLGHPVGGVVSGVLLGILEQFSVWYSSAYKETLALGIVVMVLLIRPKGWFLR